MTAVQCGKYAVGGQTSTVIPVKETQILTTAKQVPEKMVNFSG